jgi:hypothetical protein
MSITGGMEKDRERQRPWVKNSKACFHFQDSFLEVLWFRILINQDQYEFFPIFWTNVMSPPIRNKLCRFLASVKFISKIVQLRIIRELNGPNILVISYVNIVE